MLTISGGQFVFSDNVKTNQALTIDKGKITSLDDNEKADQKISLDETDMVFPGFIDLHVHGGGGHDVMEDTEQSLKSIGKHLASAGVTGWQATTYSAPVVDMADVGAAASWLLGSKKNGAEILGVYHEGPFISKEKRGAHPETYIIDPNEKDLEELIAPAAASMMTIAPELPKAIEMIKILKDRDILASIGHTNAKYEDIQKAIEAGATHVTHCFNAMSEFNHREPGTVGGVLESNELTCEIICDLFHVHPAAISLLIKTKGPQRVAIVTDGILPTGLDDGTYEFAGQNVHVKNGSTRLESGVLAGSIATMNVAVKNLYKTVGLSLPVISIMASTTPARILELGIKKGQIAENYDADLTILDKDFNAKYTIVGGNVVYQSQVKSQNSKVESIAEISN